MEPDRVDLWANSEAARMGTFRKSDKNAPPRARAVAETVGRQASLEVAYAIVCADGRLEEQVDGAGLRLLRGNPGIVEYCRALLAISRDQTRFIWINAHGHWTYVTVRTVFATEGLSRAEIELQPTRPPYGLTARELDVLTLVAAGYANPQIAAGLGASPRTITKHIENILTKMQLANRAAAAGVAVDQGLLRLPTPGGRPLMSLAIGELEAFVAGRSLSARPLLPVGRRPILIGTPRMISGLARSDAEQMFRGADLAVAEINAVGGVAGRRIELLPVDCEITDAESLKRAYAQFLDAEVDAITTGYSGAEAQLQDMVVDYGCPYLHASTSETLVQRVRDNPGRYANVFQVCPSGIHYGPEMVRFIEGLGSARAWTPHNRRVLAIVSDWSDFDQGVAQMGSLLDERGWQLEVLSGMSAGNTDWTDAMEAIHRLEPAVIFLGYAFPTAGISFQRAFLVAPTRSLVYAIYTPSIPIYREELGPLADGVLWSTTTGLYSDAIGSGFANRYRQRYGIWPGRSHAGIAYDRIRLLANAWSRTGNVRAFARVAEDLRSAVYRGVNGSYFLGNAGQSTLAYANHSSDPSISQAHLVFQIQAGRQRILSPEPYVDSSFELPWWFERCPS